MPYIKKKERETTINGHVNNAGQLNYLFTTIIAKYYKVNGECYQTYNDVIGALEGAKLELYRRKIAPYEDLKKDENGDVY